jgi:hypothetical protein
MNAADTENGVEPSSPKALAKWFSNTFQDNSVNKALPWFVMLAIIAGIAFGFSIAAYMQGRDDKADTRDTIADIRGNMNARFTETETRLTNEMRDMGVKCQLLKNHVDELKTAVDLRNLLKSKEVICHE